MKAAAQAQLAGGRTRALERAGSEGNFRGANSDADASRIAFDGCWIHPTSNFDSHTILTLTQGRTAANLLPPKIKRTVSSGVPHWQSPLQCQRQGPGKGYQHHRIGH